MTNIIENLQELPSIIHSLKLEIFKQEELIEFLKDEISLKEDGIKQSIQEEEDERGKKKFSNSETREIEFRKRVSSDMDINNKYDFLKKKIQELNKLKADIEKNIHTQSNFRVILNYMSNINNNN